MQHGNAVQGQVERALTGSLDNLCINLNIPVGLEEQNLKPKELVKIVDVLGRETEFTPNTLLIYIYDDRSTEKVFWIVY